jgi:hypothetical protein
MDSKPKDKVEDPSLPKKGFSKAFRVGSRWRGKLYGGEGTYEDTTRLY